MANYRIVQRVKTLEGYDVLHPNTPFDVLTATSVTVSGTNLVITTKLSQDFFMGDEFTITFVVPNNISSVTGSCIINGVTYGFQGDSLAGIKLYANMAVICRCYNGAIWVNGIHATIASSAGTVDASNITGTLSAAHGGTGYTSLQATRNAMGLGNTLSYLPVANGGTGTNSLQSLRNSLGLGNTLGVLPIANGGTNANSAAGAKTQLGFATRATYTGQLNTTWGGSNPYTQNVGISGILAADIPIIDLTLSGTLATDNQRVASWGKIQRAVTYANGITFYAYGSKPTVALPFRVLCIR